MSLKFRSLNFRNLNFRSLSCEDAEKEIIYNNLMMTRYYLGVKYFPKGINHEGDFPSSNFPNVLFPMRQLSKGYIRHLEAPQSAMGGQALRLRWARGPSVATRTFGRLPVGKIPFGNCRYVKCHWEGNSN